MAQIELNINGTATNIDSEPDRTLLEVLREDLQLLGTKYGCGEGACGACTVLLDGERTFSCQTSVAEVSGRQVQTIEGLADGDSLHPVQQAFLDANAFQCGHCTTGMIMSAVALLEAHPDPTDEQLIEAMNGNVCRCGGYVGVTEAIRRAAESRKEAAK